MKKAFFITGVTLFMAAIILASAIYFFVTVPIVYCGTPKHSSDFPVLLIVSLIVSAILTFPLGWLAMWLGGLNFFPVGVLANGILWGQLLWLMKQRKAHARQIEKERKDIS